MKERAAASISGHAPEPSMSKVSGFGSDAQLAGSNLSGSSVFSQRVGENNRSFDSRGFRLTATGVAHDALSIRQPLNIEFGAVQAANFEAAVLQHTGSAGPKSGCELLQVG